MRFKSLLFNKGVKADDILSAVPTVDLDDDEDDNEFGVGQAEKNALPASLMGNYQAYLAKQKVSSTNQQHGDVLGRLKELSDTRPISSNKKQRKAAEKEVKRAKKEAEEKAKKESLKDPLKEAKKEVLKEVLKDLKEAKKEAKKSSNQDVLRELKEAKKEVKKELKVHKKGAELEVKELESNGGVMELSLPKGCEESCSTLLVGWNHNPDQTKSQATKQSLLGGDEEATDDDERLCLGRAPATHSRPIRHNRAARRSMVQRRRSMTDMSGDDMDGTKRRLRRSMPDLSEMGADVDIDTDDDTPQATDPTTGRRRIRRAMSDLSRDDLGSNRPQATQAADSTRRRLRRSMTSDGLPQRLGPGSAIPSKSPPRTDRAREIQRNSQRGSARSSLRSRSRDAPRPSPANKATPTRRDQGGRSSRARSKDAPRSAPSRTNSGSDNKEDGMGFTNHGFLLDQSEIGKTPDSKTRSRRARSRSTRIKRTSSHKMPTIEVSKPLSAHQRPKVPSRFSALNNNNKANQESETDQQKRSKRRGMPRRSTSMRMPTEEEANGDEGAIKTKRKASRIKRSISYSAARAPPTAFKKPASRSNSESDKLEEQGPTDCSDTKPEATETPSLPTEVDDTTKEVTEEEDPKQAECDEAPADANVNPTHEQQPSESQLGADKEKELPSMSPISVLEGLQDEVNAPSREPEQDSSECTDPEEEEQEEEEEAVPDLTHMGSGTEQSGSKAETEIPSYGEQDFGSEEFDASLGVCPPADSDLDESQQSNALPSAETQEDSDLSVPAKAENASTTTTETDETPRKLSHIFSGVANLLPLNASQRKNREREAANESSNDTGSEVQQPLEPASAHSLPEGLVKLLQATKAANASRPQFRPAGYLGRSTSHGSSHQAVNRMRRRETVTVLLGRQLTPKDFMTADESAGTTNRSRGRKPTTIPDGEESSKQTGPRTGDESRGSSHRRTRRSRASRSRKEDHEEETKNGSGCVDSLQSSLDASMNAAQLGGSLREHGCSRLDMSLRSKFLRRNPSEKSLLRDKKQDMPKRSNSASSSKPSSKKRGKSRSKTDLKGLLGPCDHSVENEKDNELDLSMSLSNVFGDVAT